MTIGQENLSPEEVPLAADSGERRLNQLGYRQSLKRELSKVTNYCFALCVLATPLTITSLYTVGFYNGGPVAIIWGWLLVSLFTMFIVLSMAEILSSLPTAGGIYYQAFFLGGEKWGPMACWWTGWLNWAAYVSGISSVNYIFGQFIGLIVLLATAGSYSPPQRILFAISCFAAGAGLLLNLFPIKTLGIVAAVGAFWTVVTTVALVVLIPAVAPRHQSPSYVFTTLNDNSAATGLDSQLYLVALGLLMSQFSLTGYDITGYISEETKRGDKNAAWAAVASVLSAIVLGFALLLAITFSIQDPNNVLNPDNQTMGSYAAPQIFYDIFAARYGSGVGAMVLIGWISVCCIFANVGGTAAGSRLFWAMSRDGATPSSRFWTYLTPLGRVPIHSIVLTSMASIAFTAPVCWSPLAFRAMNSFTTVATYLAYGIPILMKLTIGRKRFKPGPLDLGRWGGPINVVALGWICGISVLFCMPTEFPVSIDSLNYAPLVFSALFVFITLPWLLPKAVFNFQGPVVGSYYEQEISRHEDKFCGTLFFGKGRSGLID